MPASDIRKAAARERVRLASPGKRAIDAALKQITRLPKAIAVSYSGFLVSWQRGVNKAIAGQLASLVTLAARADSADHVDDKNDTMRAAFQALRQTLERFGLGVALRTGINAHGTRTVQFNDAKYDSPVMHLLGIGDSSAAIEQATLRGWVAENVALVTNMNAEQVGKLEAIFLRALRTGERSQALQAEVEHVLSGSENRARLIARDQIGKLNGQLDKQKQTEAGLDSFVWRGSLDERERPSHVAREGKVFRWDQPPPDGTPGQPIQCRCSAEPNLEPLLGPEFAPKPPSPSDFARATPEARAENRRKVAAKRARAAARAERQRARGAAS